ncbi:MAG: hypothetical protein VB007_04600 [Methanocorpusculum sp.]|uniref:hypothetical protein n=1 Tax=Methanocorpusculum sp. TaxID=2058474 RepID=UPI002B202E38|nr:hypothetical protein [Methanocorpusculum sp.]MEA5086487.1 hypothetical protein [Methanocorpusculum sp.]
MKDPNALSYCLGSRHNKYNLLFILISIIAFETILFTLAIVPSAQGYEVSLHDIYPVWFWVLIGLLMILPIGYLFITHIAKTDWFSWKTAYWLLGISVANDILLKLFPLIRGYLIYNPGGDTSTHFGYIKDMISFGVINPDNLYPYLHTIVYTTSQVLQISPEIAAYFITTLLYAFLILSSLLIGRHFFKNQRQTIVFVSLVSIPGLLINETLSPHVYGYFLLLFYLYLVCIYIFNQHSSIIYAVLVTIYSVLIWYVHPETVLYSSIILLIIYATYSIYTMIFKKYECHLNNKSLIYVVILLIIGFIYIFSFRSAFTGQIDVLYWLMNGIGRDEVSTYDMALTGYYTLSDILVLGVELYGSLLFICIAAFLLVIYGVCFVGTKKLGLTIVITISMFIGLSIYALMNMVAGVSSGVHPERMLKVVYLPAAFIISSFWVKMISIRNKKNIIKMLSLIIIILIIGTITLTTLGMYGNPAISKLNTPGSLQEYMGMKLFFETRSDMYLISEAKGYQYRYGQYIYGITNAPTTNIRSSMAYIDSHELDHFGYLEYEYAGNSISSNRYYLFYPPIGELNRSMVSFTMYFNDVSINEYQHFNIDTSVIKTLDSGEFEVYFIYSH